MINSVQNLKLVRNNITLLSDPNQVSTRLDVDFENLNNIFVGKKLSIYTDLGIKLSGIVNRDSTSWFLLLESEYLDTNFTQNSNGYYFETFTTEKTEDNAHVTFSDILGSLQAKESKHENGKLVIHGEDGIITAQNKYMLDNELEHEISLSDATTINNITLLQTLLCNVNVQKDRLFEHKIAISGDNLFVKVSLQINNIGLNNSQFTLRVLEFSTSEELKDTAIDFKLQYSKNSVSGICYVGIFAIFDNSRLNQEPSEQDYLVTHLTNLKTIFYQNEPAYTERRYLQYNLEYLYQSLYSDVFKVNSNIESFSANGFVLKSPEKKLIEEFTDLDAIRTEGDYYNHNGNISSILNKPTNNNQRFDLEVRNMNLGNSSNDFFITQTYTCYVPIPNSSEFKIGSWVRISYLNTNGIFKFSEWTANAVGGHTHTADEITETDQRKFITGIQKDAFIKMNTEYTSDDFSWKLSVGTVADLTTKYPEPKQGWCCVVKETNTIFMFGGTEWFNTQRSVTSEYSGLVSVEQFDEFFVGGSQSKYLKEKTDSTNFINRYTENPKSIYGENYEMIFRNNIDLIKRTAPLVEPLGDYSYQQGFDVLMSGNDNYGIGRNISSLNFDRNVGFGLGLNFVRSNQIILGTYNKTSNTDVFQVGDGTDENNRSNAFSVSRESVATVKGGYSVETKTADDILVADGTTINKSILLGYRFEVLWDTTIIPLPPQTFEVVDDEGSGIMLNKHSLIFVNGILLTKTQYTIDEEEPSFFTIIDTLDNGDVITVK